MQIFGADACGVEGFQQRAHALNIVFRAHYIIKERELVAQGLGVFAQQAIVIKRANEVVENVAVAVREVLFARLLAQLIVERGAVAIHHLFIVGIVGGGGAHTRGVHRRHIVVAAYAAESLVEGRLSEVGVLLAVVGIGGAVDGVVVGTVIIVARMIAVRGVEVVVGAVDIIVDIIVDIVIVGRCHLQSRVVVELGVHIFFQLGHRHLHELHLQHLLLCKLLYLLQFLFLGLY